MSSALLVALSLAVAGFGIATAIYLEGPLLPTSLRAPQVTAEMPAASPERASESEAAASPPEPATDAAAPVEPQAGSSQPRPAETAALEPPAAAPPVALAALSPAPPPAPPAPALEAKPAYWVEYGAFAGERYARRLQQALSRQGLDAVVVATHGRDGRKLLRVRSRPLDLAAARQAADEARHQLKLAALVHRGDPAAGPERRYWVQFAAFDKPKPAARLSRTLRRGGVAASVSSVRETSGKPLYVVRSAPVLGHAAALALGERGQQLLQTDVLIGESVTHPHRAARPPPAHRIADSR